MSSVELPWFGRRRAATVVGCIVALTVGQSSVTLAQTVTAAPVARVPTVAVAVQPAKPAITPTPSAIVAVPAARDDVVRGDTTRTRFVIGLEKPAEFQVFSLSNPNRVIVDLPDVRMQLPAASVDAIGLVKSFVGGLSAPGKTRVVISVTTPVVVEKAAVERGKDGKGHRLVLDIIPVDSSLKSQPRKPLKTAVAMTPLGAIGVQPPLPKLAVRPEIKAQKAYKPIIVIDPGHGGHDSGAMKFGTVEKDVVLAFSKVLRDKLTATGRYKVLMTRDNDTFVPLDARRDFGEQNNAALFIAVHADYAGAQARGATIYSLREEVAKDLKRSAKGDVSANVLSASELAAVKSSSSDASAVKNILADFAQREVEVNKDRTSVFARSVIDYMGASTNLQNNPDRSAAFRVLKTTRVPAVLIELAYVTNRQDAANLKSDEWRDKVSNSISTAVENYFSNQIARIPM